MTKYIHLSDGTALPFCFSHAAIVQLESLTGKPFHSYILSFLPETDSGNEIELGLSALRKAGISDMAKMLYAGLYGGYRREGKAWNLSFDELLDILDKEGDNALSVMMKALGMAFDAMPRPGDQSDQKKTAIHKE